MNIPFNWNSGHGHVWARPDGVKARCGGLGVCKECVTDMERLRHSAGLSRDYASELSAAIKQGQRQTAPIMAGKLARIIASADLSMTPEELAAAGISEQASIMIGETFRRKIIRHVGGEAGKGDTPTLQEVIST